MDSLNDPAVGFISSKGWTLQSLLATGAKFRTVDRISAASRTPEQIASTIKDYERHNVPLVVEDLHCNPNWPELFTPQWLESHYGSQGVCTTNLFIQISITKILHFSG